MLIVARPTALAASHEPSESSAPRLEPARIGPNAIIQVAHVLRERFGEERAESLLVEATPYHLDTLPGAMVPEGEALALGQGVMRHYGEAQGTRLMRDAGERTGDYLLANRIPKVAQWIMRLAPKRAGLALLLKAMSAHAWTFAGSGTFRVATTARGVELSFHACAMCRDMTADGPVCDFYAGTFERLIRVLISPTARVLEVECQAHGGRCCRFQVSDV